MSTNVPEGATPEGVNLNAETVIAVQRDKINSLQWQNTLLEARAAEAEQRLAELLKQLQDRSSGEPKS